MKKLLTLSKKIDVFNERIGKGVAYLSLAMVLATFTITTMRYVFNIGYIALQESVIYMHATMFLLASAYALRKNFHVRVDVLYAYQSKKRKAMIDLLGSLLLLFPTAFVWAIIAIPYVASSWKHLEASNEAGGLPIVFLLKTLIIIAPLLLIMQGTSEIIRNVLFLRGYINEEEWK